MAKIRVPLSGPVRVAGAEISALEVEERFQVGWLRGAPPTPGYVMTAIGALLKSLTDEDVKGAASALDQDAAAKKLLAAFPAPSGEDFDKLVPWALHVVARATGQPDAVVDQLVLPDVFAILMRAVTGMAAAGSFSPTSTTSSPTSPGSSTGATAT